MSNTRPAVVPFLPTLLTALVVAGLSVLCHQLPSTDTTSAVTIETAAMPGQVGLHAAQAPIPIPAVPATLAFAQAYPVELEPARALAAASTVRPRLAARRGCANGRCAEPTRTASVPARARPETAPTPSMPLPFREAAEHDTDGLPEGALPFTTQARAVLDAARSLKGGASVLEGSVLGTLIGLN